MYKFTEVFPVKKVRGCYLLYRDGVVVYVGQSVNIMSRIGAHLANPLKRFDGFSYTEVDGNLNEAESELIATYNPSDNSDMPSNKTYVSALQIKKRYKIDGWEWRKIKQSLRAAWREYYTVEDIEEFLQNRGRA